jgi:hypothetical protein
MGAFFDGNLLVKLWWIDGGMLVFGWWFFGAKKLSLFLNLFLVGPVFGKCPDTGFDICSSRK